MTPTRYRKKPVVVEAAGPITADNADAIARWSGGIVFRHLGDGGLVAYAVGIPTLEGTMAARIGDYVVRGIVGEFHPVRGDIFAQTYEAAE